MLADDTQHQLLFRLSAVVPAETTLLSNRIYFCTLVIQSASVARLTTIKYQHSSKPSTLPASLNDTMQEFKSKIGNSLGTFFIMTISLLGLLYLVLFLTTDFRLTQISVAGWLAIIVAYCILSYLFVGLTNNDILLFDSRLEIVNRLPFFNKHYTFQFDKIKSVKFRHEWTETFGKNIKPSLLKYILTQMLAPLFFPSDYKWIKISTDKDHKFYCFGIEMDYYDNQGPLFEDLFKKLADKGIKVSWTDTTDAYYSQMTKSTENINQQS